MKTHKARYLDSGFYVITDAAAGALCRVLGQKLPARGREKFVMLSLTTANGEQYPVNAWLQRADLRHSIRWNNRRGWRWAIYSIRRDAGAYLPILGPAFPFVPVKSTVAEFSP